MFVGIAYPRDVTAAIGTMPWTLGVTALLALVGYYVVSLRKPRTDVANMVDSAHLATRKELRDRGLLGASAGPIIGGIADKLGRIVPLRYGGRLGISVPLPSYSGSAKHMRRRSRSRILSGPRRGRRRRAPALPVGLRDSPHHGNNECSHVVIARIQDPSLKACDRARGWGRRRYVSSK
jgi:hypothetical protein